MYKSPGTALRGTFVTTCGHDAWRESTARDQRNANRIDGALRATFDVAQVPHTMQAAATETTARRSHADVDGRAT